MTTSARDTVLDVRQLNAWYGQAHILFDVDLNVQRGAGVALLGRNGAGKSTTLKSLMGLVRSTGTVQFMGENIHTLPAYQRARRGMVMMLRLILKTTESEEGELII